MTSVLQRFLSLSRLWCISLIFKTIHHLNNPRHVFVSSKTVQNACKTVNLASWNSQSCNLTLTILQPHFDYFALPNIQNDTPKSQERHSKPCFPPLKTWFPCVQRSARTYQSPAIIAIIYSLHFNTIQLQPFPPTANLTSTDMSSNTRYAISWFSAHCSHCFNTMFMASSASSVLKTDNIHPKRGYPFSGSGLTSWGNRERICSVFSVDFKPIFSSQVGGLNRS